ncbi:unnamed protein product [Caenorhabditis bovis]|uniref:Globin domain-containing protein n=1 Tax=Caenorhabditis bovis TaxID=2654633 RepID=A0A8S1EZZ2_9PELO|nr:unnamed protein product [Caenorhabditis bovis]
MNKIREIWKRAKEREVGKHILIELIERRPQFKDYFGIHVDEKTDDVYGCREFMLQAHRIQNFLDTAVSSLGYYPIANILQMAYRIGQIHFYRGVNFGADNWLTFKKVTVEIIIDREANPDCVAVIGWEKFMGSVIREMKRGFLDEARRNCNDSPFRRSPSYL